jgi:hypothetical protein
MLLGGILAVLVVFGVLIGGCAYFLRCTGALPGGCPPGGG